ncbi:MAG: alpha/beta hydrolase [Microlunatus sp.]|nr:alpha/beta hydrolase [Microlunatus sp.]MDN5769670.1 alpha/beta hydrolase [Microlunatus sp.]
MIKRVRYATMEDTFLRIGDLKIRIRRRPGTGTPLLLINGLGSCLESWEPLITRLSGRDIIGIDHPGMGLSSAPNHILSMNELAVFYKDALEALGVSRADVLGFSFGGTVAQQLAKDFPEYVNSLILAGTAPGVGGFPADLITLLTASNPLRYQIPLIREMVAPVIYRGRVGRHPRLFEDELAGWDAHRATLLGVTCQVGAFLGWSSMPWLASLRLPTLVMCGEEDPMAPVANSKLMASIVPDAELRIYRGQGHLFLFDAPERPVADIIEFLDREREEVAA